MAPVRVLVRTPLSSFTGYGRDGCDIVKTMLSLGVDVYVHPTSVDPPLDPEIAKLLTKPLEGPFDMVLQHVDPAAFREVDGPYRRASKVHVGWTMWEHTSLSNMKGRSSLSRQIRGMDLLLGYDAVSMEALRPYTEKFKQRPALAALQGGYNSKDWQPIQREWFGDRFSFCMNGQLHNRKDPFLAIEAFRELKEEQGPWFKHAELHLHTTVPTLHPELENLIPNLRVHYAIWPVETVKEFYASQHVLLAPSRGEGKNLPALEFQSTGGAVIATDWGGMSSWLSPEYAFPLKYTLHPSVGPTKPNCLQARASKDHLKELMLEAYSNRVETKRRADLASKVIPQTCDWVVVIQRLFEIIRDQVPGVGEELYTKFLFAQSTGGVG